MPAKLIEPAQLTTFTFDWGVLKPLVARDNTENTTLSVMHVVLLPGRGHERHNHPDADEVLYILSGDGEQMLDDGEPFPVHPGRAVYIPTGIWHSTMNTGWEPLTLLAIYSPAGPEEVLRTLPDFREVAAGETNLLART